MIKTVKLCKKNVTGVWDRCEVGEVWLSRNGYIMKQSKVASTHRNKTDWAILRVFDHKYLFTIKIYLLLVLVAGGGGGWLPRNGCIIEQMFESGVRCGFLAMGP